MGADGAEMQNLARDNNKTNPGEDQMLPAAHSQCTKQEPPAVTFVIPLFAVAALVALYLIALDGDFGHLTRTAHHFSHGGML